MNLATSCYDALGHVAIRDDANRNPRSMRERCCSADSYCVSFCMILMAWVMLATTATFAIAQEVAFVPASEHLILGAEAVAAADLDLDGDQDLVVASTIRQEICLLYNEGNFVFSEGPSLSVNVPYDVAVADLNGDLYPDIVVSSQIHSMLFCFLHDGVSGYYEEFRFTDVMGAAGLTLADIDNDNRIDILVAKRLSNKVGLYINNPFGDWLSVDLPGVEKPTAICTGNFDNVGGIDLAVVSSEDSTVTFFHGNGLGGFPTVVSQYFGTDDSLWDVTSRKLNGDNKDDVIVPCPGASAIGVLYSSTLAGFYPPVLYIAGDEPSVVAARDCNDDTMPDLLSLNTGSGDLTLHSGVSGFNSSGVSGQFFTGGPLSASMVLADFDDDGRPDVVITEREEGLRVLRNRAALSILRGDINGDGSRGIEDAIALLNTLFTPGAPLPRALTRSTSPMTAPSG